MIEVGGHTADGGDRDDDERRDEEGSSPSESDLAQLQRAYEVLRGRLVEQRRGLVAQLEEEHEWRAELRETAENAERQAAQARLDLLAAEAKAEDLRHSVMNREDQIAALKAHGAALDDQIEALHAAAVRGEETRVSLQLRIDAVENSRTMRTLRPASALYHRLRDRRNR